jgi:CheY-like chemotaxis protein
MGLSITKQLIEQMGGEISVQSVLTEKTIFTITMDFEIAGAQETMAEQVVDFKGDLEGVNVLIVDDSAINLLVAEEFLASWNAKTVSAEGGQDALRLAQSQPFDLILMDLQMPGWSGYKTARKIREQGKSNKDTPIIAISADVLALSQHEIRDAGMNDVLTKPYHPDELQRKIKYLLSLDQ